MYVCSRCEGRKPAAAFSPDKRKRSGLDPICKECRANARRESRAAAAASRPEPPRLASVTPLRVVPAVEPDRHVERAAAPGRAPVRTRLEALEAAALATPGVLDPTNGAALDHARRIAAAMDQADEWDRQMIELAEPGPRGVEIAKLNPQYLVALREAGLTPGPRKAKPAAEDEPQLRNVGNY